MIDSRFRTFTQKRGFFKPFESIVCEPRNRYFIHCIYSYIFTFYLGIRHKWWQYSSNHKFTAKQSKKQLAVKRIVLVQHFLFLQYNYFCGDKWIFVIEIAMKNLVKDKKEVSQFVFLSENFGWDQITKIIGI